MKINNLLTDRLNAAIFSVGVFSTALGLLVLADWCCHRVVLIQVQPTFSPMQVNTAAGFFPSGFILPGFASGRLTNVGVAFPVLITAIGTITLVEYSPDLDPGIDQLLVQQDITVKTSQLGGLAIMLSLWQGTILMAEVSQRKQVREGSKNG